MFFAAALHIILHAEEVFRIGGVRITNSMLLGWLASLCLVTTFVIAARKVKVMASGKAVSLAELAVEGITNLAADVMHDRKQAAKYAPFLISLFCFILLNNWFGLLPGVGTVKIGGEPLLRAWTADLTGTLALAV